MPDDIFGPPDLTAALALSVPLVQAALDREWKESCDRFLDSLPPGCAEWRGLIIQMAPSQQMLVDTEITASYSMTSQSTEITRLEVKMLNAGFERKFAHANYARQTITLKVSAHPLDKENTRG